MEELKDEEILTQSLKDPSRFSIIVDRYQDAFLRTAFNVVRSKQEAEDIVQETFAKIYTHGAKFTPQPGASFKSWAYRILMNTSFTHYQKVKKTGGKTEYLDALLYDERDPTAETIDFAGIHDAKTQVADVIEKMPKHLGRLLTLYYLEDKSYKNIAEIEDVSMSTLKMRLFRAKRLFKKISGE